MVTSSLVVVVCLALIFDYTNGFHDAANSIATIVSTKVLTPFQAVIWAAAFNFIVFFFIKEHKVANTVSKIVVEHFVTMHVILAGLIAAITLEPDYLVVWHPFQLVAYPDRRFCGRRYHQCLVYGLIRPLSAVNMSYILKIIAYIVLAPFMGLIIAYLVTIIVLHLSKNSRPATAEKWFKRLQLVSSAALSFAHGGNDAQKVMGIIYVALIAAKVIPSGAHMPDWIPLGLLFGNCPGHNFRRMENCENNGLANHQDHPIRRCKC